jgi:hypothetical protein
MTKIFNDDGEFEVYSEDRTVLQIHAAHIGLIRQVTFESPIYESSRYLVVCQDGSIWSQKGSGYRQIEFEATRKAPQSP